MENPQEVSLWKDNIVCHVHITSIEHITYYLTKLKELHSRR